MRGSAGGRLGLQVVSPLRLLLIYLLHSPGSFHLRKQHPTDSGPLRIMSNSSPGTRTFTRPRAGLGAWDMVLHQMWWQEFTATLACPFQAPVTYCRLEGCPDVRSGVLLKNHLSAFLHTLWSPVTSQTSGWFIPDKLTHRKYEVRLRPSQSMMLKSRKQQMGLKN